jgi:Do/DeqQ family serine protease
MNLRFTRSPRTKGTALAILASALLASAAWRGLAAQAKPAALPAPDPHTPIAHAVSGARDSYADVVDMVLPAVVTVRVEGHARVSPTQFPNLDENFFGQFFGDRQQQGPRGVPQMPRTQRQRALGSGVVVSSDGYVLTNNHVVDGAEEVNVDFADGRTLTAKIIGTDKPSDLALLKVNGSGFKPIAVGNSDAVKVGDVVLAIGNPLNVGQTVTMGIVSAKGRSTGVGDGSYEDFLQTDAPINHGNSGGALVNTKGELVGINSQILSESGGNIGIGFAIPSNMARRVMDGLRTSGRVTRAQLGVSIQRVTPDIASNLGMKDVRGAIISSVSAGSAADRGGLKRGDIILTFNGSPVGDTNALRNHVAETTPGSVVDVGIMRDGQEKHVSIKLDEAGREQSARRDDAVEGRLDATALGITVAPSAKGLVVESVNPDGRAADAGIRAGDVILEANRHAVTSTDELKSAIHATTSAPTLLLISRDGSDIYVTVKPARAES